MKKPAHIPPEKQPAHSSPEKQPEKQLRAVWPLVVAAVALVLVADAAAWAYLSSASLPTSDDAVAELSPETTPSDTGDAEDAPEEEASADTQIEPSDSDATAVIENANTGNTGAVQLASTDTSRIVTATDEAASPTEIICWGDSLTWGEGASYARIYNRYENPAGYDASYLGYPAILSHFTHLTTCNFGIDGATSTEIAHAQKGVYDQDLSDWLTEENDNLQEVAATHRQGILILEIGSNGDWESYDELISQYRSMIAYAQTTQYIIVGDTDNPGESVADTTQKPFDYSDDPGETTWEAALSAAFGEHFINMRAYLIENGLDLCNLRPTAEDFYNVHYGMVPTSLRTDWTHLNSYGYYAQARGIYEKGVELGYWE